MYTSTDAVILHVTQYGDTSLIVNLFTESSGRTDCIMPRSSGKRSALTAAIMQPLNIVRAEIRSKPAQDMCRLVSVVPKRINSNDDMPRLCLRMYIAELLYRTLRQPLSEHALFSVIEETAALIDSEARIANVHLHFMLRLSEYLGFAPNLESQGAYLDMENGVLTNIRPSHPNFLGERLTVLVRELMCPDYSQCSDVAMTRDERRLLLKNLEYYFSLHIADFGGMKSTDTLLQLFD